MFVVGAAAPDDEWSRFVLVAVQGSALLQAYRLTQRRGWMFYAVRAIVLGAAALAFAVALSGGDQETVGGLVLLVGGLLVALAPLAIVDAVRHHLRIELRTVMAALTMYLLFGLFFSYLYGALHAFDNEAFSAATDLTPSDFQYLSFITLTTVGYGDITPASHLARTFAVLEALLGQLYLVTVLGLIVGNLGRPRTSTSRSDS